MMKKSGDSTYPCIISWTLGKYIQVFTINYDY